MIAKNLKRNVIPYRRTGAFYLDDSFTNEMKLYFESLDYGPVMTPNMVNELLWAYFKRRPYHVRNLIYKLSRPFSFVFRRFLTFS